MPYIELKVADKGTPAIDFKNNSIHPSAFGHVWYHIYKNENDLVGKSYGFAPDLNHQGQPFAPGQVYENDSFNYTLNEAGGDYIGRVYITEEQYLILDKFGKDPTSNDFGFSKFYSGLSNSCIDFVWTGLAKAGLVTINSDGSFFNGDVIPTWNIDNFQRLINSINNSNIGIPSVPNFQLTTPFSANLTNSQFITTIADYYKLDAVEVVNLNPDYFSNALGYEGAKISAHQGNVSNLLKNSDFTLKDINLSDHINLHQDNKGNDFSIVKDNVLTPLKDGSTATLNTILNTIDSAKAATDAFINQYMHQLTSIFTTGQGIAGLISDVNAGIQRGDAPEQIAKNIALKALVQTVGQEILNSFLLSDADKALFIANPQLAMSADASGYALLQDGVMSQNGQDALNNFANNHPVYNASYLMAVSMATSLLLNADKDWDSQEYTIAAAQATAQVSAQIAVAAAVKAGWLGNTMAANAAGAGVGAAAAYIINAGINDLFADDHMNSHQWQSTLVRAGVAGVAAFAGFTAAAYLIGGTIAGPVGAIVAGIIVSQFMGGKEYGPGEYPDPYSYLNIIAKEDGTGNIIQGIEPEGVVAIAREYYHDDIYGNKGSDNLIGKSGTNTIVGYEGNDHIEGRGDVDLLIGGQGDDEVFGGNGNDQIYGSEGNDNLYGGNGDDVIIGGTAASIGGSGSLEDGNDFIQGGNGDDQIMGEAGDDMIQGNAGNDTILGGTGNDRIEGGVGDDSILGEDGDDMILAGFGNDVIDGGVGIDYIKGNEGNDNIRGGDGGDEIFGNSGVDIIYGDEGNDIINTGSENDLAFGGLGNDIIYGAEGDDTLSGEFGNDYIIGAEGNDIIDGGAADDILFGGIGNDIITSGEGNDTIIYRIGDGEDIINDTNISGNDVLRLTEINSKLSNNTTNKLVLTKSGTNLIIQFKDESGSINANDKITINNQFGGSGANGTGSEILKKIEFADGKAIDLTNITINIDNSISYTTSIYSNIDTSIQEELALGYNDQMQYQDEQNNPSSTYNANNYNSSGEQEEVTSEKYNEVEWRSMKKKRNAFGGHYTVWYKYYEQNLSGTNGNDRIVGHWWSENIYGGDGDDQLHGGDGNDNLYGGEGNDILHGGTGADNLYGESGEDIIYGGSNDDFITGGDGNDQIFGNSGNDNINGDGDLTYQNINARKWKFKFGARNKQVFIENTIDSVGDDYIEGGDGDDKITDLSGHNIIISGNGNDIVNTGQGEDYIEGNDGSDKISAGGGNDLIYGGSGNDIINGDDGNDTIYGQEGFDIIKAGEGDDYISGGANDDLINGDDGSDTIYGDTGIDQISGGDGNDFIFGGSGADILKGDSGDDQIKGGDGDDLIEGGADNDLLYGQSGSDKIYGDAGNDYIDGGIEGDVLEGNDGNDTILGGQGNDILVDGAGSDILDGGSDSDIIILTTEIDGNGNTISSTSVDTVKNFNKNEDKIILKVSYKAPITFADIQAGMTQNGSNVEIALDNGQKIIIENITTSDITNSNFQIGLSGGENNDILFGTNGEDIIFGDAGDDKIYGGDGNDELWGGLGSDELYGEGGDDILRYEADGKYGNDIKQKIHFDEIIQYSGYFDNYIHPHHYFIEEKFFDYSPEVGQFIANNYNSNQDILIGSEFLSNRTELNVRYQELRIARSLQRDFFFKGNTGRYQVGGYIDLRTRGGIRRVPKNNNIALADNEPITIPYVWAIEKVDRIDYSYDYVPQYSVKNFYNNQLININGYNRTFDKFIGGSGVNTILMTEGNDILALDDVTSASGSSAAGTATTARVQDISVIHAGAGDDIINFSTQKYSYGDIIVYGGTGNDKIWTSSGNDKIFGQEGNDEIYSGDGNDQLNGGSGDDVIYAGNGNDSLEGGSGTNQLYGEDGDDTFIAGSGADAIFGGNGSDTVSYVNSSAAVTVNLATNSLSGGQAGNDAANDTILSIENVTGSAFNDTIIGNHEANKINGGTGNDMLSGDLGSDTYIYNANSGTDIIHENGDISQGTDIVQFNAGISASDLTFNINGNDLEIQVGVNAANKIILKDQILATNRIEYLKFNDNTQINPLNIDNNSNLVTISEKFFIASEDVELAISNPLNEAIGERRRFESLTALYGTLVFDEALNKFTYKSSANFHGIDEITLTEEDGTRSKFTIFVNAVNDAPIFSSLGDIANKEVKVEEEWSINLKDYFTDVDGDALSLSLKLQGFDNLPDWINFDSQTGIVSGKIGRDGKLNFTVTANDPSGATISDNFRISVTRNIIDDMIPNAPIVAIQGTEGDDHLESNFGSTDIINAGDGNDIILYKKDDDWKEVNNYFYEAWNIYSGDKITITGRQRSFDAFDGGDGYDTLNLTNQNDVIFLDDAIVSNVGEIAKLSSIEEINSGDGDDVVDLTSLTFNYGNVIINGGNGNDVIWGNDGNDTLNGDAGDDNLQGGRGDDTINGGAGNDIIKGYDGNDNINGGSGFDVMIGGAGNDQFIFTDKADSAGSFANPSETDMILDFIKNEDKIDLSVLGFDSITQGQGSNLSANGLEFYFKDGNTIIDDPNSNFAIKLAGEIQLGASDFNF